MHSQIKHVAPYSQYYRESANLFGDAVLDNIFRYLLAEYLHQYRSSGAVSIILSKNDCAAKTAHSYHTVNARIPELEKMGLINLAGNICKVNFEYYTSVIHLFSSSNNNIRNKIRVAFRSHNLDELRDLGLEDFKVDTEEEISELSNGSLQIADPSANLQGPLQNCSTNDLCKIADPSANLQGPLQNCSTLYQTTYAILQRAMQNCIPPDSSLFEISDQEQAILLENLSKIAEGAPESDIELRFYAILMKIGTQNALSSLCKIAEGGYAILQRGVCNFAEQKIIEKKENKKKNRENEIFALEKGQNKTIEPVEEVEPIEEVEPVEEVEQDETFQPIIKMNLASNQATHPLLPANEVLEAISDIHSCLNSGLRLFLHEVWARIPDVIGIEEPDPSYPDYEEADIQSHNTQFPYEGEPIALVDARKELFAEAYKSTKNHIETGFIITEQDEQLPVSAQLFDPAQIQTIMGWEIHDLPDGPVYVISINNIYDITQTISKGKVNRRCNGRVDVSEDKEFQRQILLKGDDDAHYKELTPMEYTIYCFLDEYYVINDDCYVERRKTLNELREMRGQEPLDRPEYDLEIKGLLRVDILNFLNTLSRPHVTVDELISVIFRGKLENNFLPLRERIMFSAAKVFHWNAKNGLLSSINPSDEETII